MKHYNLLIKPYHQYTYTMSTQPKQEFNDSLYLKPRETLYKIDFAKMFTEKPGVVTGLMVSYIASLNLDVNAIVQPHNVRTNPEPHHQEYPLAAMISNVTKVPAGMVYEYEDGRPQQLVDIELNQTQTVLLVDGAIRTGNTILRTADFLRKRNPNITITNAVVYMLRPEGEKERDLFQRLADQDISLHWILTARELLHGLYAEDYITDTTLLSLLADEDFN